MTNEVQRIKIDRITQIVNKLDYECRPFIRCIFDDDLLFEFVHKTPEAAFHSFFSPKLYLTDYSKTNLTQNEDAWIKKRIKVLGETLVRKYRDDPNYLHSARFVAQALEKEQEYPDYPSRPLSLIDEKEYISYMGSTEPEPPPENPNLNWYQSNCWDNWIKIHENKQVE